MICRKNPQKTKQTNKNSNKLKCMLVKFIILLFIIYYM